MTFDEFEQLVTGLTLLFREYVSPDIQELSIGNIVSCVGTVVVVSYLEDLNIGYGAERVVVKYPKDDEEYAKGKVELLYKTLVRRNSELNKSYNL